MKKQTTQELELKAKVKELEAANYALKEERDATFDENKFLASKLVAYEGKVKDLEEKLIPKFFSPVETYDCEDATFTEPELALEEYTEDFSIDEFKQYVELEERLFILSVEQLDGNFKYLKFSSREDAEKAIGRIQKERWNNLKEISSKGKAE